MSGKEQVTFTKDEVEAIMKKVIKEVKTEEAKEAKKPGFLANFILGGVERAARKISEYNDESERLANERRARIAEDEAFEKAVAERKEAILKAAGLSDKKD